MSSRSLTNRTASRMTQVPSLKTCSTMRASPQMSRVMSNAPVGPFCSARITSQLFQPAMVSLDHIVQVLDLSMDDVLGHLYSAIAATETPRSAISC